MSMMLPPATIERKTHTPERTPRSPCAPLTDPWLVLPKTFLSPPECPFDVASTDESTVAVLRVLVNALVENVMGTWPSVSASSLPRNTSAKSGALSGIGHTLLTVSQLMVTTLRSPLSRPSTSN